MKSFSRLIFFAFFLLSACTEKTPQVLLSGEAFEVELALTQKEWTRGLMYRETLAPNKGMLFIGQKEIPRSFWMRNTYVSLDIIYLDSKKKIVSIAESTTPLSEASLPSRGPAQYVLEVIAGTAKRLNLKAGDPVVFQFDEKKFLSQVE